MLFGFSIWVILIAVAIVALVSFIYDIDWYKVAIAVIAILFVSGLYRDGKLPEKLEPIAEKVFFWVDKRSITVEGPLNTKRIDNKYIYRPSYNAGTCRTLSGDVYMLNIYVDDDESSWTYSEAEAFQNKAISPDLSFLAEQAVKWGTVLDFQAAMYVTDAEKNISVKYNGSIATGFDGVYTSGEDILNSVSKSMGFSNASELYKSMQELSGVDQVAILLLVNKDGRSYSSIQYLADRNTEIECSVVFSSLHGDETSSINHEFLHLFGAEDLYEDKSTGENSGRAAIAKMHYPNDIMLVGSSKSIGAYTAYAVGWTDVCPEECMAPEFWEGHWSRE